MKFSAVRNRALLICVVIATLLSSCGNGSKQSLQKVREEIAEINSQCPVDMGIAGTVTGAALDEGTSTVQYMLKPNAFMLNEAMFADQEALLKKSLLLNLSPFEAERSGAVELAEAGYNMAYIYSFPSGHKHTLTLTAAEIIDAAGGKMTPAERGEMLLKTRSELSRLIFPTKVDAYTTQTGVELLNDRLVHQFMIDEDALGMLINDPQVSKDALYEGIVEDLKGSINDPAMRSEMEAVVATGRSLVYHYTGSASGSELEVEITPETVRSLFH